MSIFNQVGSYIKIATLEARLAVAEKRQERIVDELTTKLYHLENELIHTNASQEMITEIQELEKFIDGYRKKKIKD